MSIEYFKTWNSLKQFLVTSRNSDATKLYRHNLLVWYHYHRRYPYAQKYSRLEIVFQAPGPYHVMKYRYKANLINFQ